MKKGLYLVSFAVGTLVGSAASYFVLKKKFEKIAQEEIDSVKEKFSYKLSEAVIGKETEGHGPDYVTDEDDKKAEELNKYNDVLKSTNYGGDGDTVVKSSPSYMRVISPVDLGEYEYYKIVGLTYYADGVLADEDGNIVSVHDTIGADALNCFGEYDDGAVHVRNTKRETDYEVLLDERDYSEVFH